MPNYSKDGQQCDHCKQGMGHKREKKNHRLVYDHDIPGTAQPPCQPCLKHAPGHPPPGVSLKHLFFGCPATASARHHLTATNVHNLLLHNCKEALRYLAEAGVTEHGEKDYLNA